MNQPDVSITKMQNRIEKWSIPEPMTGCWYWIGSIGNSGYGKTRFDHSNDFSAHRISYLAFRGVIPEGMCVLHRCDVRLCVNPSHLFLGTKKDNSRDMVAKGRHKHFARFKTTCPKGHEYSGRNSNGARICKICASEARQRYLTKQRGFHV